jgi:hypothetical protein
MSFALQFRRSAFAKFDPKLARIFEKHIPTSVFENEFKFEDVYPAPTFGLKGDPPASYFGKNIKWASFKDLDGSFGSATFINQESRVLRRKIIDHLQILFKSCQNNPEKELPKFPARVVSAAEGGFIIGIGPVMAYLPQSEMPVGINFNYSDILDKKAYFFRLKSIEALPNNKKAPINNDDVFCESVQNSKFTKSNYDQISSSQAIKVILTLKQ